jgi:hypothetical protein
VELKKYITSYYKSLFGTPQENSITLDEERRDDIPQVSEEENMVLMANFSEQEVKRRYYKWNIINHQAEMGFRLNSNKCFTMR